MEIQNSRKKMVGSLGSEAKGARHVRNYIVPYLSKRGKQLTEENLKDDRGDSRLEYRIGKKTFSIDLESDGELYVANTPTHRLGCNCGPYSIGTEVEILHLSVKDDKLYAHTVDHGVIPTSALEIPEPIRKKFNSKGFSLESEILQGRGRPRAGAAPCGYDFAANGSISRSEGIGYAKHQEKPIIRGEAKLIDGKMGQTALKWCNGKWKFVGNKKMHPIFKKAKIHEPDGNLLPLIEYLNKYHSDGHIDSMLSAIPAKGTSRHYLNASDINTLHIHEYKKVGNKLVQNHGTSFMVGGKSPKTSLKQLSKKEIDKLDGIIKIEATRSKKKGKTIIVHRPNRNVMREYAKKSLLDKTYKNLTNKEHGDEFLRCIEECLNEQ